MIFYTHSLRQIGSIALTLSNARMVGSQIICCICSLWLEPKLFMLHLEQVTQINQATWVVASCDWKTQLVPHRFVYVLLPLLQHVMLFLLKLCFLYVGIHQLAWNALNKLLQKDQGDGCMQIWSLEGQTFTWLPCIDLNRFDYSPTT